MNVVFRHLSGLEVKGPAVAGQAAVFPVFGGTAAGAEYMLLDDALKRGLAGVEEKGGGGSVPVLVLINKSDTHVLVLQGDEVIGGKQNRIINVSVLAPPKSVVDLPASCVEQGRWRYVSRRFSAGDKAFLKLRLELHEQVTQRRRETGMPLSDQGQVWRRVAEELSAAEAPSPTGAMRDAYERKRTSLLELERRLPYVEGATGLICAVAGRIAFAETFDRPAACRRAWPRLVHSLVFEPGGDASEANAPAAEAARCIFTECERATIEEYPSPGVGTDLRLTSERVIGSALAIGESVIHCSLFARVE
jgi:hypothetical protein